MIGDQCKVTIRLQAPSVIYPKLDVGITLERQTVRSGEGLALAIAPSEPVHVAVCRLGLDGKVPDHSSFSVNRNGRFRDSGLLRQLFETVVERCMAEGLVGGEGFAVDASLIQADANKQRSLPSDEWDVNDIPDDAVRAVKDYLATLDDAAFGAASAVTPKFISPSDPAAQWTGAKRGPAFFAYATNYLIDTDNAIIVDVEASRAIRQAEVGAARTMIDRVMDRFGLYPERLVGDTAYGAADMLDWLVNKHGIEPHIPVFDKSRRVDGTFSREDFAYELAEDRYICPNGKELKQYRLRVRTIGRTSSSIRCTIYPCWSTRQAL